MTGRFALIVGEALVDLIEDVDEDGSVLYRPRYGGSPFNVAVGVCRLGQRAEFVGALGEDAFGRQLRAFLRREGVGVERSATPGMGTCLSVASTSDGRVRFEYFGDAAAMLQIGRVDPRLAERAAVIHAGSTVFNGDPAYTTAVELYRSHSAPFKTIDPNPRPFLIADPAEYRARLEAATGLVDLIKLSGEDVAYLYPGASAQEAARRVRGRGRATVIVTRAGGETVLLQDDAISRVAVPPVEPVDPTGAGDGFMACILAGIVRDGPPASAEGWRERIRHANAAAALTCSELGGAEAMPTAARLAGRLRELESSSGSGSQAEAAAP